MTKEHLDRVRKDAAEARAAQDARAARRRDDASDTPSSAAQVLGSKGGKERAEVLPPQTRHEIARNAASERWRKE